uniref:Uncharacterized mitochondrial protein AtMg00810-like n=1 Tax=Nicotiana tabacum TaxID=4097 RepID=A0A1S4BN74_TOBAC
MSTVKTLVAVEVKTGWPLFQLDVNNAFLYGDVVEKVYMRLPPGLSVSSPPSSAPLVCKLQKSLYGLRQASRGSGDSLVIIVVYVDDIVLTGTDLYEITALKYFLHDRFKIKDLGLLNYFLGIEMLYTPFGVFLHQKKFINDLLKEFHCDVCTPVVCPLELNEKLKASVGEPLPNPEVYRNLIRKLNFLTLTRPDLSFAVQHLSQFMQKPCVPHTKSALHLLRYLNGTSDPEIFLNNSSYFSVQVYCDSDWGPCPDSRRSVTSFCILLGGSLVCWKSKKQAVISLSSAEAEYRSLSKVVAEVTWLARLLVDFGITDLSSIPIYCDNQTTIHITKNHVFHERTKHIELDCHFVRTKLADGLVTQLYTSSSTQMADDVALAIVSMRPILLGPIMEKLSLTPEKYGTSRRFYVQTLDDRALSPDVQEKLVRKTLLK